MKNVIQGSLITTFRCNAQCNMCNIWKFQTNPNEEIDASYYEKLPAGLRINITGGEPTLRRDIDKIFEILYPKSRLLELSTNGYNTQKIVELANKYPNILIRVSVEGLPKINDTKRGIKDGFDHALRTMLELKKTKCKNIGFSVVISPDNYMDLLHLYDLCVALDVELGNSAVHNSWYFHKDDNVIINREQVCRDFETLVNWQLKENNPKSWFRAWFNMGLINYIEGNRRMLPCEAGMMNFFIDPYGEVYPCNGLEEKYWKESMGNIRTTPNFMDIWNSDQAEMVRAKVRKCPKNCWMVGTASPVMKKYIKHPAKWVIKNKLRSMMGKDAVLDKCWHNVGQDPQQGDLRETF